MIPVLELNPQGFSVVGLNFDYQYGQEAFACFKFMFHEHTIEVSTGSAYPSQNKLPDGSVPILVTNIYTGAKVQINGSVQDAITYVLDNVLFNTY